MPDREAISKTHASCFVMVSKHAKTIKALGLCPHVFISFLKFGNPAETLSHSVLKNYLSTSNQQLFWRPERQIWIMMRGLNG